MMMRNRRAFTLIELLTVLAITGVLMTLIIYPVIQSFNLTRSAQGFSEAQDRARILIDRLSREIGNAAGVRANEGLAGSVAAVVPGADGQPETVILPYTKLDLVVPAQGDPSAIVNGAFVDPNTGKGDPTLRAPKGQVVLPAAPGAAIVRYWVGLRRPFAADPGDPAGRVPRRYDNPYDGLLTARSTNRDNLYVLYRAEVQPIIFQNGQFRVNTALFLDVDNDGVPDDIDDPAFFTLLPGTDVSTEPVNNQGGALTAVGQAKAQRMQNWLSRASVVTEISRYDMIRPIYDKRTRAVTYDRNAANVLNVPRLVPLIQLRPTRVTNEPAEGMTAVRQGQEAEGMDRVAPDVFRTQYGAWTNPLVRLWPAGASPRYLVARPDPAVPGLSIFAYEPALGPELSTGTELFDIEEYASSVALNRRFPFSRATAAANVRSGWLGNQSARDLFEPFVLDSRGGRVVASFEISEVGDASQPVDPNNPRNLPVVATGPALTPNNDPGLAAGVFSDAQYASINRKFNKIWNDYPALRPNLHRFVDLRVTPTADGTASPLNPNPAVGFDRARIVPGSEVVFGPDQVPGANYGAMIRYTRTVGNPGPNQYRLNYVNLAEPTDYTLLGVPNPPAQYTATDFVSAVIQPRFRAGYLQFNSDPNVPLPQGNIFVSYRFQFTGVGDVVAVDYDSREIMSILLTIRNYPQTTQPDPQSITLNGAAKVRNFLR
ncbi:MAG: type II secretion system GspH family protein [Fimbriimonadaceae bacterium]|nr:type II secretion system GspH family protein [Fimbriimonadaceae bacterium]